MAEVNSKIEVRPLYEIASEIKQNWVSWRKSYAEPYINAMSDLSSIDDNYMFDSAKSIVLYFLANAQSWRGEAARRIKAELKAMVA